VELWGKKLSILAETVAKTPQNSTNIEPKWPQIERKIRRPTVESMVKILWLTVGKRGYRRMVPT
jgi:hypothetical protein